tara:strand:+ start:42473 stop:43795 length:1323 start_codon:yes stop_codon:yes gene_type:complete
MLSAYNIIAKKRDGLELSKEEIKWFLDGLIKGSVMDYQMSALLMAIYLQGMTTAETAALTDCMLYSGEVLDFTDDTIIDKHSTGGVGDKTSFILAPIAAACGVKVPMIAGRGLGHTGGTVDKIEAVKGFKTDLTLKQFRKQLEEKSVVLIGQTGQIAPADKRLYALRDVTATIESIPLITASIMSKKLAEGARGIVMDIKYGNGAFMKKKSQAKALAKSIRETGLRFNRNMMTVLSDMNQPLGFAIGNSLEIIECVEVLKGKGPKDLIDLSIHLAGGMIHIAGLAKTLDAGKAKARKVLKNGEALKKFKELIELQDGDSSFIDNYKELPIAKNILKVTAPAAGYLKSVDNTQLGLHCVSLGGGRMKKEDKIDFGVGFYFYKKIGNKIKKNDVLAEIYYNDNQKELAADIAEKMLTRDIKFSKTAPKVIPLMDDTKVSWRK